MLCSLQKTTAKMPLTDKLDHINWNIWRKPFNQPTIILNVKNVYHIAIYSLIQTIVKEGVFSGLLDLCEIYRLGSQIN
jgi:hypothetical protein